jgi:hypothetical protein
MNSNRVSERRDYLARQMGAPFGTSEARSEEDNGPLAAARDRCPNRGAPAKSPQLAQGYPLTEVRTQPFPTRDMTVEPLPVNGEKSAKFKRLIDEAIAGDLHGGRFDPWEIELLLDIESCALTGRPVARQRVLRQYQETAQHQMEAESDVPLRLSEYLESLKAPRRRRLGGKLRQGVSIVDGEI